MINLEKVPYEEQFMYHLRNIYENGYADGINERTGLSTKRLPGRIIQVDVNNEFPILKSKKVFFQSALKEILWIMQKQSNEVKEVGSKIWDEWETKDGTIGKAYGYQVGGKVRTKQKLKVQRIDGTIHTEELIIEYPNQVTAVLETLRRDPNCRR